MKLIHALTEMGKNKTVAELRLQELRDEAMKPGQHGGSIKYLFCCECILIIHGRKYFFWSGDISYILFQVSRNIPLLINREYLISP